MSTLVSVVVPTLGRAALPRAIRSAREQAIPGVLDVQIIVVDDSGDGPDASTLVQQAGADVTLATSGRTGAAAARNAGFAAARGDLVALLDDDDLWLPGHLASAVALFERRPEVDVYCSRGLVVRGGGADRIEPVDLLGDRRVADYFFGADRWRSRCRRILTPTVVVRARLAEVPMDESLRMSEDTWWLLTLEAQEGAKVAQSDHVGLVTFAGAEREAGRRLERDELAWARRLEGVVAGAGTAHLLAVGRDRARLGDVSGVAAALRDARSLPPPTWTAEARGAAAAETVLARALARRNSLRRG